MDDVVYRPFRAGDSKAINDGFNEVFGLARPLAEWEWKFPAEPEGRWIFLAVGNDGRILAHYGAVAMQVRFGTKRVRGGQIVDAYSREEVRGTRVFSTCYEHFVSALCNPEGLSLGFGFPGRRHYEMGLKALRYVPISSVPFWCREVRGRLPIVPWRYQIREGFNAAAIDDLWRRSASRYDVAIVRDAAWLGRRFCGRPGVDYVHLSAWRRGRARAWVVARPERATLRWADLIWDGEDPGALAALDRALDRIARRLACTRLELWLGGDRAAEGGLEARRWERQPCPQDLLLVARTFSPAVDLGRMNEGFYLTMGDSDLV